MLMNKEKNDLLKQLTLLQGQLSQMENSKKQAEEKIFKLTSELQEVNAQLKQNNNKDQSEIQELRKTVKKMEEENQTLLHDVQTIRNLLEAETSQEQLNLKRSQSAQSLQEEMTKAEGSEMYDSYGQNQDALFRKSLELRSTSVPPMLIEPGKSQQKGQYGACFFVLPDKSENEGGGRLQTLISKYRSHSENETADLQLSMKPLSGNVSSNLVSKSRFSNAVPTTNVKNNSRSLPTEAVSEQQERSSMTANQFSKSTKVLPSSNTIMHTSHLPPTKKSSFMSTLSREDDRRETAPVQSGTKLPSSVRRTLPSVISGKTISSAGT
uniref:Uncharacterized protein n=1 Tax=Arion vulgaris TaxID=1028688 RepID=A0A0B6YQL5_9EUPU